MSRPGKVAAEAGVFMIMILRGLLLWFILIPAIIPWVFGLVVWPLLRPFGLKVPVSFLYYSRWATHLLDALLTRVTPIQATPWPWQIDVRNSRIGTWGDAFDPTFF